MSRNRFKAAPAQSRKASRRSIRFFRFGSVFKSLQIFPSALRQMRRSLKVFTALPTNSYESQFGFTSRKRATPVRRSFRKRDNSLNLVDYQNLEPRALLAGLVEFDTGLSSSFENASSGDGPTLVVSGDFSGVTDAERRTITFSTPSGAEITPSDVTLTNANFVIPQSDFSTTLGTFNLFSTGNLAVTNDAWLEGNEQFTINITGFGIDVEVGNADGDSSVRSGTTHDIVDDETGVISIVPGQTIDEAGTSSTVTTQLTITGSQSGAAHFSVAASASLSALVSDAGTGGATDSGIRDDFNFADQTITYGSGAISGASRTVSISAIDDTRVEGNETIGVSLSALNNDYDGKVTLGSNQDVVVTDNDSATVSFVNATSTVAGENSNLNVQVRLTPSGGATEIENDVTVNISDALTGDATTGTDYTFTSPALVTFNGTANGGSTNHITETTTVAINTDEIVEADELVNLSVDGVSMLGGQVSVGTQSTHAITIVDNDTATLSVADVLVDEDAGTATVTVVSDKAVEGGFSVDFGTAAGTAATTDFTANSGTLNFAGAVGETQTFTVAIIDDGIVEGGETINISLSGVDAIEAMDSDIVATDTATVTIVNEDTTTLSVADVSVSENGTATVTVTLNGPVQGGFDVNYATALSASTSPGDFTNSTGILTFTGNDGETQTFDIAISDDQTVEGAEDINVTLSNVVPTQANAADIDESDTAIVTIIDNDSAVLTVADITVDEATGTATVSVSVDKAVEGGFSVDFATSEGTVGASDFTTTAGTLNFDGNANEIQTFSVVVANDSIVEGAETILVALSNVTAAEASVDAFDESDEATITVTDNDSATLTAQDVTVNEETGVVTVTVEVNSDVEGGFTVDFSTADDTATASDYTTTSGSLTFAGNAGELQTFTIILANDTVVEGAEVINVNLSNVVPGEASSDAFDTTDVGQVTIENTDTASLTVTDLSVDESAGTATVTVALDNAVEGGFSVGYETGDGFLASSEDYASASGTLNFTGNAGETRTFLLNITGDSVVELDETIDVSLTNVNASEADVNDIDDSDIGEVTILDNDSASLSIEDVTTDESAGIVTVTIKLNGSVQGGFTVGHESTDGTSDRGSDYFDDSTDVLSFTGIEDEEHQLTFGIDEDDIVEADEDFVIGLVDLDAVEAPVDSIDTTDTAAVTITDNDSAVLTVSDQTVDEDAGLVTVTVAVDNPVQGGFVVSYATADGTATNGSDNTPASGTLSFAGDAAETHTFTFLVNDDDVVEASETLLAGLTGIVPAEAMVSDFDISDTGTVNIMNNDAATFSIGDVLVNENDGTATISVSVDNAVQGGFSVGLQTSDLFDEGSESGHAQDGQDYTGILTTLVFAGNAGETQSTTVSILNDDVVEADKSFIAFLTGVSETNVDLGNFNEPRDAFITITDEDTADVTVSDVQVDESTGTATVTVTVDNAVEHGFVVNYASSDGLANGADYTPVNNVLFFDGEVNESQTFNITLTHDEIVEANETINIDLVQVYPSTADVADIDFSDTAIVTIENDDAATLTVDDITVNEDAGTATVSVTVNKAVQGGFVVSYQTADGTTSVGDYTPATGALNFDGNVGETKQFTFAVNEDAVVEANEIINVALSNVDPVEADAADIDAADTATVTITNNDMATLSVTDVTVDEDAGTATVTVSVDKAVQDGFSVDFATNSDTASDGDDNATATGSLGFEGTVGETEQFTFVINNDAVVEANESLAVVLSNLAPTTAASASFDITDTGSVTIVDNDSALLNVDNVVVDESAGIATVTVSVNNAVQSGFDVDYQTSDGTAVGGVDNDAASGTLTFSGNVGETQTFEVPITSDLVVEADETINITLLNVVPVEASPSAIDSSDTAQVTITDNDSATLTVEDVIVNEADSTATITVSVDAAVQAGFAVDVATASDTADNGVDLGDSQETLTFMGLAGESLTFTVPITNDNIVEADETFLVSLSGIAPVEAATDAFDTSDTAEVMIVDNDMAAVTVADISVNENSGLATVRVQVDKAVQGGFTVNYDTADVTGDRNSDYNSASGTLTFAGDAGESHTFQVTINDDEIVEADEQLVITLSDVMPSEAEIGDFDTSDEAMVSIIDDDSATLTVEDVVVDESVGFATVIVSVDRAVQGGFDLDFSTSDGTANVADYTSIADTVEFTGTAGESQSFLFAITDDFVVERNETINVSLTSVSPDQAEVADFNISDSATVTITNNETAAVTVPTIVVNEANSTVTVDVVVDKAVQGGFDVSFETIADTATVGSDFSSVSGTLDFTGTASETQTFTLTISEDAVLELDEVIDVALSNLIPGEVPSEFIDISNIGTIQIIDDETASLSISDTVVNEDVGTATIFVSIDTAVEGGFMVDVNSVDGSGGIDGVDISSVDSTLTFNGDANESQSFEVDITNDAIVEALETLQINIVGVEAEKADAADIASSDVATITINDNDTAVLTVDDVTVNEADGTATVTVQVDNAVEGGFAVDYATSGISAVGGVDNTDVSGTAVFAGVAGETQTFTIPITNDMIVEGAETINVALSDVNPAEAPTASFTFSDTAVVTIEDNDTAVLSVEDISVDESVGMATVTIVVDNAVQGGFTVDATSTNDTADSGDATESSNTIAFSGTAGESATFQVAINEDTIVEGDETINISLSNIQPTEASSSAFDVTDSAVITIENNDTADLSVADVIVNEDVGTATVVVALNNAVEGGFTVDFNTSDGTGTDGSDTTSSSGTLTFNGTIAETRSFEVDITNDMIVEASESIGIALSNVQALEASNEDIGATDTAIVTINDNDIAVLSIADVSVSEAAGTATVTVTVDNAVEGGFTVEYGLETPGGFGSGNDDVSASGVLNFNGVAGESVTFEVTINDDQIVEGDETHGFVLFNVQPTEAPASSFDASEMATVTVEDNDTAVLTVSDVSVNEDAGTATVTVTVDNEVAGGFTVDYSTENGTADAGNDNTAASGQLTFDEGAGEQQTFTVPIINDMVVEGDETINISLSNVQPLFVPSELIDESDVATVTIEDNDAAELTVDNIVVNEDVGTATVFVTVNNAVQGGFSVDFASTSGTGIAGDDATAVSGSLLFNGTIDETKSFEIDITNDAIVEGSETINVVLSNVQPTEAMPAAIDATDSATVTITDNDVADLSVEDITVNEADGTATVTVVVNNAVSGGFTVDYQSIDGSAVGGSDNTAADGVLTFAGEVGESQTFTLDITNDAVVEGSETLTIELSNVQAVEADSSAIAATDTAIVTIEDNDTATLTVTDVSVDEAARSASVTVRVDNAVEGGFSVNFSTDESRGESNVLFFSGVVGEERTLTVFFDDDSVVEADEFINVTLFNVLPLEASPSAFDTEDAGVVTINNDDSAILSVTDVVVDEESGTAIVTVTVDNAVQGGFTVDYEIEANDDLTTPNGTLTFNGNVGETQTFEVDIVNDSIVESTETVGITLANVQPTEASAEDFDATDSATVTIQDVDVAVVTVTDVFFSEETGVAIVEVTVDNAVSGGFSVDYATIDGTATDALDYTSTSGTLNFNGESSETQTFEVAIKEDLDIEVNETFNIALSNVVTPEVDAERLDATDTATGTIVDDESQTEVGESGHATNVTHEWQTINLTRSYVNPVVIAGPSSRNGANPIAVRVRNVTSNSFELRVDEWDYQDEFHTGENVDFMVLEAGTHHLSDGTIITAGTKTVSSDWAQILPGNDEGIFLTTVVTENDSSTVTVRMRNDGNKVVLRLMEEEAADDIHATETVSWVQIDAGSGDVEGMPFVAGEVAVSHGERSIDFGDNFESTPTFFADIQTFLGADTSTIRVTSIDGSSATVFLDEETSLDDEIFHTNETVGFFALEPGVISAVTTNEGKIGETGVVSVSDLWTQVNFSQPYRNPVVVMGASSTLDAEGATPRVRNVTSTGFEVRVQEWDFLDGTHATENVSFIVMESGLHVLEDGSTIVAGTADNMTEKFRRIQFPIEFDTTPVVLGQVVSNNDTAAVVTRQAAVTTETFLVGLREEETGFIHGPEQVSWIAIEQGVGVNDSRSYEIGSTGNAVSHGDFNLTFAQTFNEAPAFFAQTQSFNGGDNGVIRYRALDENGSMIFLQEDQSFDDEIFHTFEEVGYFAFEMGPIFSNARPAEGRAAPSPTSSSASRSNDGSQNWSQHFRSEGTEFGSYEMVTSNQNLNQGSYGLTLAGSISDNLDKDTAFASFAMQNIDSQFANLDALEELFGEDV